MNTLTLQRQIKSKAMPRKKDGLKYELLTRPTKGDDGKPLLYARPAIGIKYSMRMLDDFCHEHRGMHQGELTRALQSFMDVAVIHMKDGARVETPFGSFVAKIRLDGDYTDPKKIKSKNVQFAGIDFIPSKEFLQSLNARINRGFLQVALPASTEQLHDPEAMKEALRKALKKGYTTVNGFCYHSGLKYHTAKNYLNKLCEGDTPLLRKKKEGTNWHFSAVTQPQK